MRKQAYRKIKIIIGIILLLTVFPGGADLLRGDGAEYVLITMKNGDVKKMLSTSFKINWTFPVTFLEEDTCERKTVEKKQIKDIFPVSTRWNGCENKEDWLFEVDFFDGNYAQGFLLSTSKAAAVVQDEFRGRESVVKGRLHDSNREELIDYKDIKKISFVETK